MRTILFCLLLAGLYPAMAQKKPLVVGEKVPYSNSIAYQTGSLHLAGLKGPVIIDLFSSNCVVCFQMMPKINELQQQFAGRLRFLLLGRRDKKIEPMYRKFEERLKLKLEVAFDSLFFKQVQVNELPTYIWIGSDGRVTAVTGPSKMSAENIELFVQGRPLPFSPNVQPVGLDAAKPYLLNGNGGPDSNYFVRSVLGPWQESLSYRLWPARAFNPGTRTFNVIGADRKRLYNYAYWGLLSWSFGDSLYGRAWQLPLVEPEAVDLEEKYCYSVSYNGTHIPDLETIMRKDLESFFGYAAKMETREMPVYVLKLEKPGLLRSKGGPIIFDMTHAGFKLHNRRVEHLVQVLSYYDSTFIPFLDQTGIDYPLDLEVETILTNQADFFAALREQGILIVRERRPMKVLVLRPKKDVAARQ